MRQVGVIAAGALYALEHHRDRLAQDHAHAKQLAEALAQCPAFRIDLKSVETNIVNFDADDAPAVVAYAKRHGVHVSAFSQTAIRAVTHLDLATEDISRAIHVLSDASNDA